jgi:hypothetical protein
VKNQFSLESEYITDFSKPSHVHHGQHAAAESLKFYSRQNAHNIPNLKRRSNVCDLCEIDS